MADMKTDGYEVLSQRGLESDDMKKARTREGYCVATPDEVDKYRYSTNRARNNKRPGIPGEDNAE